MDCLEGFAYFMQVLFYYGQSKYWIIFSRGAINTGTRLLGFSGLLGVTYCLPQLMSQISIVFDGYSF